MLPGHWDEPFTNVTSECFILSKDLLVLLRDVLLGMDGSKVFRTLGGDFLLRTNERIATEVPVMMEVNRYRVVENGGRVEGRSDMPVAEAFARSSQMLSDQFFASLPTDVFLALPADAVLGSPPLHAADPPSDRTPHPDAVPTLLPAPPVDPLAGLPALVTMSREVPKDGRWVFARTD
jgi:hypothetical protein